MTAEATRRVAFAGVLAVGGAAIALAVLAADRTFAWGVHVAAAGVAVAAFGLLDLAGAFEAPADVAASPSARPLAHVARRLVASAGALALFVAAVRLATRGALGVAPAALAVPAAFLLLVASVHRIFARGTLRRPGFWVVAGATLLYLPLLGSFTLVDPWEPHYAEVAREMIARDDWISPWWAQDRWFFSKPVLDLWLEALGMRAFGVHAAAGAVLAPVAGIAPRPEWAVRMPAFLFAVAGLYLLYKGVTAASGRRAGLLAAIALATMPQFFLMARQATTDMALVGALAAAMGLILIGASADPLRLAPACTVRAGRRAFSFSAAHLVLAGAVALVLPQILYLASRNLTLHVGASLSLHAHADPSAPAPPATATSPATRPARTTLPSTPGSRRPSRRSSGPRCSPPSSSPRAPSAGSRAPPTWAPSSSPPSRPWPRAPSASPSRPPPSSRRSPPPAASAASPAWRSRPACSSSWPRPCPGTSPCSYATAARSPTSSSSATWWAARRATCTTPTRGDDVSFRYYVWQLGYALFGWAGLLPAALARWPGRSRRGEALEDARAARRRAFGRALAFLWLALTFALFTAMPTKFHHYIFPALPPAAALIGLLLDEILAPGRRPSLARRSAPPRWAGPSSSCSSPGTSPLPASPARRGSSTWSRTTTSARGPTGLVVRDALAASGVGLAALPRRRWPCRGSRGAPRSPSWGRPCSSPVWGLDVYLVRAAPHWGQRALVEAYYRARAGEVEPLAAWNLNWKGENFYTGNRVAVFPRGRADPRVDRGAAGRRGRAAVFFLVEHGRVAALRRELGAPKAVERLTDVRDNNKFVLLRVS